MSEKEAKQKAAKYLLKTCITNLFIISILTMIGCTIAYIFEPSSAIENLAVVAMGFNAIAMLILFIEKGE